MKKVLFIVLLVFVASLASNAQSFSSKSEDSFFKVKKSPLACGFSQNLKMDDKFSFVPDDENDTDKKRRKKKRRGRGRGRGSSDYQNVITIDPLWMIVGYFSVNYERVLNENISLTGTIGYFSKSLDFSTSTYTTYEPDPFDPNTFISVSHSDEVSQKYSCFSFSPEMRYYFEGEAPEGWYAGPYLSLKFFNHNFKKTDGQPWEIIGSDGKSVKFSDYGETITTFAGGATLGRQWIWGGFTLNSWIALGYYGASYSQDGNMKFFTGAEEDNISKYLSGFLILGSFSLGYAF